MIRVVVRGETKNSSKKTFSLATKQTIEDKQQKQIKPIMKLVKEKKVDLVEVLVNRMRTQLHLVLELNLDRYYIKGYRNI